MKICIDLGTSNSSAAILDRITEEVVNVKVSTGNEPYDSILRSCALLGDTVKIGSIAESEYTAHPTDNTFIDSFKPYLNETQLRSVIKVKDKPVIVGYDYHLQQPIWSESERSLHFGASFSKTQIMRGINSFLADILAKSHDTLSGMGEDCDGYLIGIPLNAKAHYRFRLLESVKESSPYAETYRSVMWKTTFIPEPVAVSYCFNEKISTGDKKVLIFDYGGGTLDLALLEYEQIGLHVLPVRLLGLSCLDKAGRYIDDALKQHLMNKYRGYQVTYNDLDSSRKYFEDQQIESIKIKLSLQDRVQDRLISGIVVDIDRREFRDILKDLLQDIDACIEDCLSDAKLDAYEDIDKVIMSGGSSLIPAIQQHLIEIFGKERIVELDPKSTGGIETALTGVSRGLAKYDHFIEMSGLQVNKYKLWNQNTGGFLNVLDRNVREGEAIYDPRLDRFHAATLAIFYDMIKEEPLICLTGLLYNRSDKLTIKFVQDQIFGVFPKVTVTDSNGTLILKMDFSNMPEAEAERMIKRCDWRFSVGGGNSWEIPSIPFEAGNLIKIKNESKVFRIKEENEQRVRCNFHQWCLANGRPDMCEGQTCDGGIVTFRKTGIRDISKGNFLNVTNDWDLSHFVFDLIYINAKSQTTRSLKSYEVEIYI